MIVCNVGSRIGSNLCCHRHRPTEVLSVQSPWKLSEDDPQYWLPPVIKGTATSAPACSKLKSPVSPAQAATARSLSGFADLGLVSLIAIFSTMIILINNKELFLRPWSLHRPLTSLMLSSQRAWCSLQALSRITMTLTAFIFIDPVVFMTCWLY